ncbi:DUF6216 family protein [Pseudomonas gingeri]
MTDQTFTAAMHLLDVLYKLWPIVCGLVVVSIVYYRTRSFFFIFHQILKWLGLEGKYTNPKDQKVADDYLDLNKFNLKTGFRLNSVKAKSRLHEWLHDNDFEFAELRHAGWYFKANQLKFDLPGRAQLWLSRSCFILIGLYLISMSVFIQKPGYALLTVTATGTEFWVGKNEAFNPRYDFPALLRGNPWKIQQGDCRYLQDSTPIENSWDKDVICGLVLGFADEYLTEAIDSQKKIGALMGLAGLICFGLCVLFIFWQLTAVKLSKRLLSDDQTPTTSSTPITCSPNLSSISNTSNELD